MYDADDLLDDFSTEARLQAMAAEDDGRRTGSLMITCWSMVCFLFSSLPKQLIYGLKMAHDIKEIREKLDDITKDKDNLYLEVRFEEVVASRETDSCPPTLVAGREDDKKNIIQLLLETNCEANISVVSIVGIGGLGKTTLAQLVFDDKLIQDHFAVKVWVYVSQKFDVKIILGKMLESITHQSQTSLRLDVLQAKLRREITGKKFLFVLDDVWEEDVQSWEILAKYLINGAPGSKVLLTTRSTEVAGVGSRTLKSETSTEIGVPYFLGGLSVKESWNLFLKRALNGEVRQKSLVEGIGKKILEKCYGVPLAISTISGLLSSKNPETEWGIFLENKLGSINREENAIVSTLILSYNHLPSHMKRCFAYCKLFSKGHKFDVQMLVQFWTSQGYVESEDKWLNCFRTLWWRSFFQEVEMDEYGNMSKCRMHDLMHDLADFITGEKILRISSLTDVKNITSKTRHLALFKKEDQDEEAVVDYELGNANKVRTLVCEKHLSRKECEWVLLSFRRLRVLLIMVDGLDRDSSTQMHSVGKLKHLRFLSVNGLWMETFPNSITNLLNLQVIAMDCALYREFPMDIKKLVNLKHLCIPHSHMQCFTHMPKGFGELKSLQTLPVFVVAKRSDFFNDETVRAGLDELKELKALRGQLIVRNLVNVESIGADVGILNEMLLLQSLILDWGDADYEGTTSSMCSRLPKWLATITYLVEVSLSSCKKCEYLPPLHQLLCLKRLRITDCPQLKGMIDYDGEDDEFRNSITATANADEDVPSFHCLAYLYIRDCPKLCQMATFPMVQGNLELIGASLEPLAKTMGMRRRIKGGSAHYSDEQNPFLPCPSVLVHLRKLALCSIDDDLDSLPGHDDDDDVDLPSLEELFLWDCRKGSRVCSLLCSSTNLTVIRLFNCKTIEYLPPLHKLPSLSHLNFMHCPKLKGCLWKKIAIQHENGDDDDEYYWPSFPRLSSLISISASGNAAPHFFTGTGDSGFSSVDPTMQKGRGWRLAQHLSRPKHKTGREDDTGLRLGFVGNVRVEGIAGDSKPPSAGLVGGKRRDLMGMGNISRLAHTR
ncbi:Putative disease resistance protein RGA3 [Linum perenne]